MVEAVPRPTATGGRRPRAPGRASGRRVALYGLIGTGNLGNDASFEAVRAHLGPRLRISAVTTAPSVVRERYAVRALRLRSPLGRWADVAHSAALVGTVDAVAVPGMGVLEETLGTRFWGLPLWLFLVALAARVRGRRFALVAVGAEPVRHPVTRWLFRSTVRLATHVSYRDAWSAAALGRGTGGRVAPDVAFAHPALSAPVAAGRPGTVLVGVLDWHGWADDRASGAGEHATYVERMTRLVLLLLDAGDRVLLTGGDRVDDACATAVRTAVLSRRPGAADRVELRPVPTYDALVALVDEAEAVVGTRYHTLVCGLSRGRPTVSVAYAEKNARLLEDFGLAGSAEPIATWDPRTLHERLVALRADLALPARLAARAGEAGDGARRLLSDVADDLERA